MAGEKWKLGEWDTGKERNLMNNISQVGYEGLKDMIPRWRCEEKINDECQVRNECIVNKTGRKWMT